MNSLTLTLYLAACLIAYAAVPIKVTPPHAPTLTPKEENGINLTKEDVATRAREEWAEARELFLEKCRVEEKELQEKVDKVLQEDKTALLSDFKKKVYPEGSLLKVEGGTVRASAVVVLGVEGSLDGYFSASVKKGHAYKELYADVGVGCAPEGTIYQSDYIYDTEPYGLPYQLLGYGSHPYIKRTPDVEFTINIKGGSSYIVTCDPRVAAEAYDYLTNLMEQT